MKNVWIALPAYTGQVHLATMRSIITDMLTLAERGDRVTIFDECGNAMIADGRALMVAKFMADEEATDLVFVDADVAWEAGALVRLVDSPVDFCAGIYPQRKDPINYCVQWIPKSELWADPETGLLEVAGVPAGFMRITRDMLQRMIDAYPDTEFYCEVAPNQRAWALFDPYRVGRIKFGEDFSFCRRWRDIGGQIWIDAELRLAHIGFKTFMGSIGDWLRERMQTEEPTP